MFDAGRVSGIKVCPSVSLPLYVDTAEFVHEHEAAGLKMVTRAGEDVEASFEPVSELEQAANRLSEWYNVYSGPAETKTEYQRELDMFSSYLKEAADITSDLL